MSPVHSNRTSGWRFAKRSTSTSPSIGTGGVLRPLARRVHFLAGILVAPFLLMLCLTGLAYVFSPQIHNDLYGGQLYVKHVGIAPNPVAEQVAAALMGHPEAELQSVIPPPEPDRTTRVNLSVPGMTRPGEARTVFVDPYTNRISGELNTVDNRLPANIWLRDLHGNLHLGEPGRLYAETASSWLGVIVVAGLVLWIGKQGRRPRGPRELLVPLPRGSGEHARLRAVHAPLGLWLALGLLAVGATGLIMSPLAGWGLPDAREPTLAMAPVANPFNVDRIGLDRVVEVARAQGLSGEFVVTPPTAPDRPYTVVERSPGLPIQRDSIAVDPYTADVTERIGWDDYPLLAQLRELGTQAHTGTLFGLANQIVLTVLMIGTIVLIIGGYRMWWKRSPYRGQLPATPPPAVRQLTVPVGAAVALVGVGLAWLLPTFGVSLVAFVAVDLVINAIRQRQERVRRALTAGVLLAVLPMLGAAALAYMSSAYTSTFVSLGDTPEPSPGHGRHDGGAAPELDPSPRRDQAAPNGALDVGTARPTSRASEAIPGFRTQALAGIADRRTASATPSGSAGTGATLATGSAGNDSDDGAASDSSGGGDTVLSASSGGSEGASSGSDGEGATADDAAAAQPTPAQDADRSSRVVYDLVGTLTDVAAPLTSPILGIVDGVAIGLLGK